MNPITKAITDIKMTTPKTILDLAYNDDRFNSIATIESRIETVIRKRVLVDTNLVGGVTIFIDMTQVTILEEDQYGGVVVEIPERLLDGRAILSVHSLVTNNSPANSRTILANSNSACENSGSSALQESLKIKNNLGTANIEVTSNIEVIGERIIYIRDDITNLYDTTLRLVVENQRLLNNLPPRAYINFSILCRYAVQADIYIKLVEILDNGYIKTGHQLPFVERFVSKYEDSEQLYMEYLTETWPSVLFMSDSTEMNSYIQSIFSNNM